VRCERGSLPRKNGISSKPDNDQQHQALESNGNSCNSFGVAITQHIKQSLLPTAEEIRSQISKSREKSIIFKIELAGGNQTDKTLIQLQVNRSIAEKFL
jgi:hypothetical protein